MLSATNEFKSALDNSTRNFNIIAQLTRNTSGSVAIDISDRVIQYTTSHDFESRAGRLDITLDNYDYTISPQNRYSSINQVFPLNNERSNVVRNVDSRAILEQQRKKIVTIQLTGYIFF